MEFHRSHFAPVEPQTFGRYKVRKLLGEGAMGRVYLADDPVLDRRVAIKVIAVDKQPDNRTREEYLKRFSLEAKASAKLNHPSIVAIFDAGDEAGVPWIAFEYVDGERLEEMIVPPKLLPIDKILSISLDIASALHHAHECGIIHRDIKPANILIDKRTQIAKLSDFGVVKAPWVALTQDGTAVGSPGYMAPEQLDGSDTDARCDLFSFGIVLYQMLSGKHPFLRNTIPATIYATLHSNYQPVEELRPDAPASLTAIVARLLQSDRARRIQTAALLLNALREAAAGRSTVPSGEQAQQPSNDDGLMGNTTRIKRISHTLQRLGRKGLHTVGSSSHLASVRRGLLVFVKKVRSIDDLLARIPLPDKSPLRPFLMIPLLFIAMVIASVMLLSIVASPPDERRILRELREEGWRGNPQQLVDTCAFLLDGKRFSDALRLAWKLARLRRVATQAYILLGRVALLEGNDSLAIDALRKAAKNKDWRRSGKSALPLLLHDCSVRLTQGSADSALTETLAATILRERKQIVTEWTRNPAYWLRWNGVRLSGCLNLPVDSVEVYILDLQHAGSVRTRTRAATRLGELGDKRAIPHLKKAATLGLRDPVVSYTADLVLENYFKDSTRVK